MKTLISALSLAAGMAVISVGAADLPRRKAEPKMPIMAVAKPFSWTGIYLGAKAGYATGKTRFRYTIGGQADHDINGFVGGLYAGYNHQFQNNIVLGAEADANFSNIQGSTACPNPTWSCKSKLQWYSTVRARAGYAFDRILPYVTGGVAYGDIRTQTKNAGGTHFGSSKGRVGYTVGAGVEYAITDQISARIEYGFTNFGKKNYVVDGGLNVGSRQRVHTVMIGISYKF